MPHRPDGHRCVFCGRTDIAKRAHVLPDWISKVAPVRGPGDRTAAAGPTRITTPTGKLFNERVRRICQKECNGGWMSDLEKVAKPILTPLIQGKAATLSSDDQAVIGRWAALTAVMACFIKPEYLPPADYLHVFYEEKGPPPVTVVWIARHQMEVTSETYVRRAIRFDWDASPSLLPPRPVSPEDANGYMVTLSACYLALKAVWFRPPSLDPTLRINVQLDPYPPGLGVIWPPRRDPLDWPPGPSLDDVDMRVLSHGMLSVTRVR